MMQSFHFEIVASHMKHHPFIDTQYVKLVRLVKKFVYIFYGVYGHSYRGMLFLCTPQYVELNKNNNVLYI